MVENNRLLEGQQNNDSSLIAVLHSSGVNSGWRCVGGERRAGRGLKGQGRMRRGRKRDDELKASDEMRNRGRGRR
eukprot:599191-Hanusia_phi.AAC.4